MKKKVLITLMAGVLLTVSLGACGKADALNEEAAAEAATIADETAKDVGADEPPQKMTYMSEFGFAVSYDPKLFEPGEGENMVQFVYTGESAGTNMVIFTYVPDKEPEEALSELSSGWGDDSMIDKIEGVFPGTDDEKGYWHILKSTEGGSGLGETGIAGAYKDGTLLIEVVSHLSGDDGMDVACSDAMSYIIDSIKYFDVHENEDTAAGTGTEVLPAYEYTGDDPIYAAVYDYVVDTFASHYEPADVSIPLPNILDIDDSDESDIKVYGDFWILNYNLNGTVLENVSGGSYPGCIHMVSDGTGYKVESMDMVGDGSEYDPTARKIFGDRYDAFVALTGDNESSEKLRAQIIADYVEANSLNITAYKDYGWDPVALP